MTTRSDSLEPARVLVLPPTQRPEHPLRDFGILAILTAIAAGAGGAYYAIVEQPWSGALVALVIGLVLLPTLFVGFWLDNRAYRNHRKQWTATPALPPADRPRRTIVRHSRGPLRCRALHRVRRSG
jgi:hypothetical protein